MTVRRLQKECLDLPPKLAPVNLTAVLPSSLAYLTAWPCDRPQPGTSSVNAGRLRQNLASIPGI